MTSRSREVCSKYQTTEQAFYRWRNKFSSITVLKVQRLKELEHENAQLKQIVEDLTRSNRNLRDVNQKSGEAVRASNMANTIAQQRALSVAAGGPGF